MGGWVGKAVELRGMQVKSFKNEKESYMVMKPQV